MVPPVWKMTLLSIREKKEDKSEEQRETHNEEECVGRKWSTRCQSFELLLIFSSSSFFLLEITT